MKNLLLIFLFTAFACKVDAQSGVMLEAGGPGGYYSVNYKGYLMIGAGPTLKWRLGYSTYRVMGVKGDFHPDVIVPFGFEYYIPGIKRLSAGAGLTFSGIQGYSGDKLKTVWRTSGFESVSFDFLQKEHAVASVTAYLLNEPQKPFRPWAGVSFTYLF